MTSTQLTSSPSNTRLLLAASAIVAALSLGAPVAAQASTKSCSNVGTWPDYAINGMIVDSDITAQNVIAARGDSVCGIAAWIGLAGLADWTSHTRTTARLYARINGGRVHQTWVFKFSDNAPGDFSISVTASRNWGRNHARIYFLIRPDSN
jgi:hypothetical protein